VRWDRRVDADMVVMKGVTRGGVRSGSIAQRPVVRDFVVVERVEPREGVD